MDLKTFIQEIARRNDKIGSSGYALPHPAASELYGVHELVRRALGQAGYMRLLEQMVSDSQSLIQCINQISAYPETQRLLEIARQPNGQINSSMLYALLAGIRFQANEGRIFEVERELDIRLAQTDIGSQAPAMFFRAPFPSTYFSFKGHAGGINLNTAVGTFPLVGAYLTELTLYEEPALHELLSDLRVDISRGVRCYETILISGENMHPLDSPFNFLRFYLPENHLEEPLEDLLAIHVNRFSSGGDQQTATEKEIPESMRDALYHVAKILLYLGTNDSEQCNVPEKSNLKAELERKKGGKKAKLVRKMDRAYDRIVLGPKTFNDSTEREGGRSVSAHWRRGHFRSQPYGEGRALRRPKWIRPVLVSPRQGVVTNLPKYEIK